MEAQKQRRPASKTSQIRPEKHTPPNIGEPARIQQRGMRRDKAEGTFSNVPTN